MSQQPCLPLPRRRKRRPSNGGGDGQDAASSSANMTNNVPISSLANMDAMEYLGMVHGEAEAMDDVFVAPPTSDAGADATANEDADTAGPEVESAAKTTGADNEVGCGASGSAFAASYLLSSRTALPPPPTPSHLPPGGQAWVDRTLDDFSRLRLYLDSCLEGGVGSKGGDRMAVPPMKDGAGWHAFTLGRDEARGNVGGYYDDDSDSGDDDQDDDKKDDESPNRGEEGVDDTRQQQQRATWQINTPPAGHTPTTSLLCQMDQVMTRRVLAHHVRYLTDGWDLTSNRCRWIYALLARLAKPLHRDDAAMVRELLRECCVRRAGLDLGGAAAAAGGSSGEKLALLNTLIAVVGVYFEQGGGMDRLFPSPCD